ncbi:putative reverse transcriptase domain-containing protein [Tanacetum coccineum]|uniref:Reverse transcriptase domain-containing protein n=1 Tax=Tanacetum coccineum TaxID=301880 RepID=A0ABQ5BV02_9ASTR
MRMKRMNRSKMSGDEEERDLALADSDVVVPTGELVSPPEGTESASISLPLEAEVERLLAMPTPPLSPHISLLPPSTRECLARIASTQALVDAVTDGLLSPPLPPSLYIPPPVDHRNDIPESEWPPRKRSCLFALAHYGSGRVSSCYNLLFCHWPYDAKKRRRGVESFGYGRIRRGPNTPPNSTNPNKMTPEYVQAMIDQALLRNSTNRDGSHSSHEDNRMNVKFATYTLFGAALTWWNGQIRTLGPDAYSMTWEVLKKKITDKYCPQGEIKKLEVELWNLKFVANETEKVDKYISGLPDNIYGNVKSSRPRMLDETIELANDMMDQKLRTYVERQTHNKRKADDSSRNNHGHQQ